MRTFTSGATRDTDEAKLDYEGFFSPLVLERRAQYMHKNRVQADGGLRTSDNWQRGIPFPAYMKSLWRHFFAVWRGHRSGADIQEELCAVMFNAEGYLHELLKRERPSTCESHVDYPCGQPCACFNIPALSERFPEAQDGFIPVWNSATDAWSETCGSPGYRREHS